MDSPKRKIHFITFAPFLKELNGHVMDYHCSLHKAFSSQGAKVTTLVPKDCKIDLLPKGWVKELNSPLKWSRRSVFAKLFPLLVNFRSFVRLTRSFYRSILPRIEKETGHKTILFFETFNTFHLYALSCIIPFLPTKNLHLWILYRYDSKQLFFKGKKDSKLLRFLKRILFKKHLLLFADTDVLAEELSQALKQKVHETPIPHTQGITPSTVKTKDNLLLWWPGVPRRPKGLHFIQKICTLKTSSPSSLTLRLSEKTPDLPAQPSIQLDLVAENLNRELYLQYLQECHAVLLPYNIWNYQYSSSGIFIEAISAQKIPFVSRGLWISSELEKHGLAELILDFDDPKVLDFILEKSQNLSIHNKIAQMAAHYRAYHNEQHYASFFSQYL